MINSLLNKTVAILGLARSGMAAARELKQRGVHVIAWDEKDDLRRQAAELGALVQNLAETDFSDVEFLILSPGIPHTHPAPHPAADKAKKAGVKIISDIELFMSTYRDAKYIGITGTNGKSTTSALIHHILKENGVPTEIGGNFGIPVFDLPILGAGGYYVFEISSYQIETTPSLDLDTAILLNITPDHLERHGGIEGYVAAKKAIFRRARKKNYANIIAIDDEYTKKIFRELGKEALPPAKNIPISFNRKIEGGYWMGPKNILVDNTNAAPKEAMDLKELENLKGRHNWQNVAAAFAAARQAGIASTKIVAAIKSFKTLEHRVETVGIFAGVEFVNDSKATNAESVKFTLQAMDEVYWIAGGQAKEGGIDILKPDFKRGNVKRAFLTGECEKQFYADMKNDIKTYKCRRLEKAVIRAFKYAVKDLKKGKVKKPVILLSPAAASFDHYKSYEERGEHFKKIFADITLKYKKKMDR